MMAETEIQEDIRQRLCKRIDVRVFRNNNGVAYLGTPEKRPDILGKILAILGASKRFIVLFHFRMIRFGLRPGSADLIGWKSFTITPDMVGKRVAQFLSVEVKRPGEKIIPESDQEFWKNEVNRVGGIGLCVNSFTEADFLIDDSRLQ